MCSWRVINYLPRKVDFIHQPWATGLMIFNLVSVVKWKHYKLFLKIRNMAKSILTCKKYIIKNNFNRLTLKHNIASWFVITLTWSPGRMPCLFDLLTFYLIDVKLWKRSTFEGSLEDQSQKKKLYESLRNMTENEKK